jgi:hypothetical protein
MSSVELTVDALTHFLTKLMRMSHIYQPLMLKVLIERGGWASIRDIALAFLAHDESQIEYYAEITKRMPGRVLGSHGVIRREGDGFRLLTDVERLTPEQRDDLIRLCDNALEAYRQRRGDRIYRTYLKIV